MTTFESKTRAKTSCLALSISLALFGAAGGCIYGAYASAHDGDELSPSAAMYALGALGLLFLLALLKLRSVFATCRRPKPTGPLAGVKVLDLSVVVAAPLTAALLGELGAEVIKVESIGMPDSARGLGTSPARGLAGLFLGSGRSKQSVMLNLKSPDGLEIFKKLAAQCDVMIQNFRPGAVDKMGIGYEDLKAVNPELIYLSSSGFGPSGPRSSGRIYDPIIQVLSGFANVQASHSRRRTLPF